MGNVNELQGACIYFDHIGRQLRQSYACDRGMRCKFEAVSMVRHCLHSVSTSMLKQRIITGFVVVLALFSGIYFLPPFWFFIVLTVIGAAASIEWAKMYQSMGKPGVAIYPCVVIALSLALYYFRDFAILFYLAGTALWLLFTVVVLQAATMRPPNWMTEFSAFAIITLAVFAMAQLLAIPNGKYWLMGMIILVGVADSAAFFAGRRFGKSKLAPNISPGKTREGLIGGLLAVWAISLICGALIWGEDYSKIFVFALIFLVCALFSVVGDLYLSLQKRICGVKDSGSILPGHGGILDRIDSALAVAPVYTLCVTTILT